MTLPAGTRLGSYELLSLLGAGGMGEVYRARDKKLDRDVAIKVLPGTVASDPDSLARFEREAKAIAALSHPNILSIFDFGTQDGVSYAVMELLEGETLRGKLDAGAISQQQAVDYALQATRGLSAAHEKGIVHRDLKPENLFITRDGHLKILDFGLAKRTEKDATGTETSAPTELKQTGSGVVMGTLGYMSPEQVRGLPLDHRSDIFSFGAVLYEMLSGGKAFKKGTAADTVSAILKEEPPELSESGRNVSPALDHVIKHCLEKERSNRFQSAKDVAFALSQASGPTMTHGMPMAAPAPGRSRALGVVAAIVVLAVAAVVLFPRLRGGGGGPGDVKRLAVLPFENLGAPEEDYFADGIADEVRGKLTSLPGVEVIARASSTPYRKTAKTPKQIADELGVKYLLTATVRWEKGSGGSRVEVTPELVEVKESGAPTSRWQQPFDAALTDVFQVQADIASRVAAALGVALGAGEKESLSAKPTSNLAAYDAFLKGEEASKGMALSDVPSVRRALDFYDRAVALDPGFAQAWARVSGANSSLYYNRGPTRALAEQARRAAERAVALAPTRPEGYLALGTCERLVSLDFQHAMDQYEKGLRVAPGDASLLRGTALAEEGLGRWDAAVEHFRQAERLDPRSVNNPSALAGAFLFTRRYREARNACDRGLALAPASLTLIEYKAMTFLGEGDLAGARAVFGAAPGEVEPAALVAYLANTYDIVWALDDAQKELLLRLTPAAFDDDPGGLALSQAWLYALKADTPNVRTHADNARKAFEEQVRAAPEDPSLHLNLALAFAYLGRKEEAIREGERGVALDPVSKDARDGPYHQHQLARIYMLVGEPDKALDTLEPLLKIPYFLSPGWLRIDPTFDPLRATPRFQKLAAPAPPVSCLIPPHQFRARDELSS
jgi:TolB-like protein/Flp pilus assembly protein TadD